MAATTCWILTNGHPGYERQCSGLALAAGLSPRFLRAPRNPWLRRVHDALRFRFLSRHRCPDILISSGSPVVALAKRVKDRSRGNTFSVYLQKPRTLMESFDLVILPRHDEYSSEKTWVTFGALHDLTEARLDEARARFQRLLGFPGPRLAVLVGGPTAKQPFGLAEAESLARALEALAKKENASVFLATSPRTPKYLRRFLGTRLAGVAAEMFTGRGPNPYLGYLACADYLLVTADSISMITEAGATGKPVYLFALPGQDPKKAVFLAALEREGRVKPFAGSLEPWSYPLARETEAAAAQLSRRFEEFRCGG